MWQFIVSHIPLVQLPAFWATLQVNNAFIWEAAILSMLLITLALEQVYFKLVRAVWVVLIIGGVGLLAMIMLDTISGNVKGSLGAIHSDFAHFSMIAYALWAYTTRSNGGPWAQHDYKDSYRRARFWSYLILVPISGLLGLYLFGYLLVVLIVLLARNIFLRLALGSPFN